MKKYNFEGFVADLKKLKPTTISGAAFVSESLNHAANSKINLRFVNYVLEGASQIQDASLNAWCKSQSAKFDKDSIAYRAMFVQEAFEESDSANMQQAAETIETVSDTTEDVNAALIKAIAIDKVLDRYDMYPEITQLIKAARQAYFKTNPNAPIIVGDCNQILSVIDNDIMGWPVSGKWYNIDDDGSLRYASNAPSAEAAALLSAIQIVDFDNSANQFVAQTCIGKVIVNAFDTIIFEGHTITGSAFAERVKSYMTLNQMQMEIGGTFSTENAIANAIVVIANSFDKISLLDSSVYMPSANIAVLAPAGKFNIIDLYTGDIYVYSSIIELISALQLRSVSEKFIECIKAKWSIAYDDAVKRAIGASSKIEAYQSTLQLTKENIQSVMEKMQSMNPTSEGYAAHQQILDRYSAEAELLQSKIDELLLLI